MVVTSVFMSETVPASKLGFCSTAINTGIVMFLFITACIQGQTLPGFQDEEEIAVTTGWRYGFIAPGIVAILNSMMWICLIRYDSLYFLIEKGRDKDALEQFKRVYNYKDETECKEEFEKVKDSRLKFLSQVTEKVTVTSVMTESKFRAGTIFFIIAAFINQMTGINALNIYSATIFAGISEKLVAIGPYLVGLSNVVGGIIAPIFQRCFTIRSQMILGMLIMSLLHALIVTFKVLDMPIPILFCIIGMILFYQMSMGPYFWVYVSQVANESQNSIASAMVWVSVLLLSLTTASMIEAMGIVGTFMFFSGMCFAGGLYFIRELRST